MTDFIKLCDWADARQTEILQALSNNDGNRKRTARELGCHRRSIDRALVSVSKKAAISGYSPEHDMTHVAPAPFVVKGVSTYYNAEGKPTNQWVKTKLDHHAYIELVKAEIGDALEGIPPIKNAPAAPLNFQDEIIPWIQIGDAHLGMLAYDKEVGDNFDVDICVRDLTAAFSILIDELPDSERIVIQDLGDFTHYENAKGLTEASGHALDCDGRFPRMIKAYRKIMVWMVLKALSKGKHVDVIINQGNHSRTNDWWMAELLRAVFSENERVHILNNESVFIAYRMGNTLVMCHHSDQCRPDRLADVMTTDFRKDYGETEFHYVDIGHIHHRMVAKEHPGVTVESWNQLAGSDKYAHDHGWRSRRSMAVVLRSKLYGEVGRRILPIEEVRAKMGWTPVPQKVAYSV